MREKPRLQFDLITFKNIKKMNNHKTIIPLAFLFFLAGCATPGQVKQLSVKQSEYFDAAIEAITLQSEALIIASEKLTDIAKENIDQKSAENQTLLANLIIKEGTEDNIKRAFQEMSTTAETVSSSKSKLDNDLLQIKTKTEELRSYLTKMKEVHMALDAYIQSEKAGEKVVNNVLNQPSVNALLVEANGLLPKVKSGITDVSILLNQMGE